MLETVRLAYTCTLATVHEWLNACLHMAVHGTVTGSWTTNDIGDPGSFLLLSVLCIALLGSIGRRSCRLKKFDK